MLLAVALGINLTNLGDVDLAGPLHMETTKANSVVITEEHTMAAPNIWMITWGVGFGTCPSDEGQTLDDLEISAYGVRYGVRKIFDQYGSQYWLLEAPANDRTRTTLTIRFKATLTLNRRILKEGPPEKEPTLPNRSSWLRIDEPEDAAVAQKWIQSRGLRRIDGERDVVFAKRVLEHIQKGFRYKFIENGERGVPACVRNGFGACGELNALAVDILRLNGIPARLRQGRNAGTNVAWGPETTNSYHVAAEFWGEGIGWIPIEASATGPDSNERGLEIKPFLGVANGDHVSKHYNFVHLDSQTRSFQSQDWVFGRWEGTWDGWKVTGQYGVSFTPLVIR